MSTLLYNLFLLLYSLGIRVVSIWNKKARRWLSGREKFPVFPLQDKTIWMHCSSLGEFEQGRPLLEALKLQYPDYRIVLSFFSPSGYEIMKNYSGADQVFYLPMDNHFHAKKLIASINPSLVLWVKYEYWYYYLSELKKRKIPVLLVSGIFRENQPFFKWYGDIWRKMLGCFDYIFVQDNDSLNLLKSIGISENVKIAGDTRFDRVISIAEKKVSIDVIEGFTNHYPVLVAGSTWQEDEIELQHFVHENPQIRFIIAPHETDADNLQDVKKRFKNAIFFSELSGNPQLMEKSHILIIDNVGMLSKLYRYADVTFVGGGFGTEGVHNVLEAAVYGKPVVMGPVFEKYPEALGLVEMGAAFSVNGPLELEEILKKLFSNHDFLHKSGAAAKNFVYNHVGATNIITDHIQRKRLLIN